jgi:hypothetical protein
VGRADCNTCVGDPLFEHDQNCLLVDTWNILLGLCGHALSIGLPNISELDFLYVILNSGLGWGEGLFQYSSFLRLNSRRMNSENIFSLLSFRGQGRLWYHILLCA